MTTSLAQSLMDEFAIASGLIGDRPPRRYLWTDAYAVCNYLGLARQTGEDKYLQLAERLVEQVHFILGRHRDDDPRCGWISGLPDAKGTDHPTQGGLRIGKELLERGVGEPYDPDLEWERDGQYYHYLTKWMHALYRMSRFTEQERYHQWAVELATAAHNAFTYRLTPGGPKRMYWKMSTDLKRPLVSSMGQHDPLDGLITYLELQTTERFDVESSSDLGSAIADMTEMISRSCLITSDPLGIGGLLDDATRLAELIFERRVARRELLSQILKAAEASLQQYLRTATLYASCERRLAFRELGLSIGIHGLERIMRLVDWDRDLVTVSDRLQSCQGLAAEIETFWSDPAHRRCRTWTEHPGINAVMLATSLAPDSYLQL
ncbi:MAG: hypothetical protein ACTHK7_01090 [Aureliella sp.]